MTTANTFFKKFLNYGCYAELLVVSVHMLFSPDRLSTNRADGQVKIKQFFFKGFLSQNISVKRGFKDKGDLIRSHIDFLVLSKCILNLSGLRAQNYQYLAHQN